MHAGQIEPDDNRVLYSAYSFFVQRLGNLWGVYLYFGDGLKKQQPNGGSSTYRQTSR